MYKLKKRSEGRSIRWKGVTLAVSIAIGIGCFNGNVSNAESVDGRVEIYERSVGENVLIPLIYSLPREQTTIGEWLVSSVAVGRMDSSNKKKISVGVNLDEIISADGISEENEENVSEENISKENVLEDKVTENVTPSEAKESNKKKESTAEKKKALIAEKKLKEKLKAEKKKRKAIMLKKKKRAIKLKKLRDKRAYKKHVSNMKKKIHIYMNVSKPTGLSKKEFVKFVKSMKCDYKKLYRRNAGSIYDVCHKYHINEIFFMGIIAEESGWGKSRYAQRTNNYTSQMRAGGGLRYFSSAKQCFEVTARNLSKNYLNKKGSYYHGKTIWAVNRVYCEPGINPSGHYDKFAWTKGVYNCMKKILS